MTRAALALARGDWQAAIHLHPLAPLVVPTAAVLTGVQALRFVLGRTDPLFAPGNKLVAAATWVFIAAMALVWIARWFGWMGGPVPVAAG